MRRFISLVMSIVALAWVPFHDSARAQDDLTGDQVRAAIDGGVKYLLGEQNKTSGKWSEFTAGYRGGVTALCTLALLNSGLNDSHPQVAKALRVLDSEYAVDTNYVISLQIMVFSTANPKKYLTRIQNLSDKLIARQYAEGPFVGGWTYGPPAGNKPDASNSQFALLALHEARLAGATIERQVWARARMYWLSVNKTDTGGFAYYPKNPRGPADIRPPGFPFPPTGSMTCAGLASMIIVEENLNELDNNGSIQCCGEIPSLEIVNAAFNWLDKRWTLRGNPYESRNIPDARHMFYYLYSIERAGRLSGRRFIGENRDWYREIAKFLVERRQPFGGWRGIKGQGEDNTEITTSFALLFLSKGLRPIVVGKYKHGIGSDWDRHPKGVHYLTREIESLWKQKLNWQTINGNEATTNELLQAPVLFISGRDSLSFSEQQKSRLKEFVENGGFIFAEACQGDGCGDASTFDRRFRQLLQELFPNSSLQPLPESHPIWNAQFKLLPDPDRPLLAMQTSCRTAVVYCPANLSCLWQYNQNSGLQKLTVESREKVRWAVEAGVNVITYATNRELKQKLDTPQVISTDIAGDQTRIPPIPKLVHGGGADAAPNAWNNILNRAKYDLKLKIRLEKDPVQPDIKQIQQYPILFMHGRTRFSFSEAQRNDLKLWIDRDGFLFADSICGSAAFANSFREEIRQMYPDGDWKDIPGDHEIWTDQYDGYDIRQVTLREPIRGETGLNYRDQKVPPQLEGLFVDGRIAVILSKYDLSCAMESATASQCKGYLKEDAAKIGVNVLLYALQ